MSRLYEAMFLVDSSRASAQPDQTLSAVREILTKREVEVLHLRKWDDRKLAYEIGRHKRGTYYLSYFRSDGMTNKAIERDCQLSETVMRILILRADHMTEEDVEKLTAPAVKPADVKPAAAAAATTAPAVETPAVAEVAVEEAVEAVEVVEAVVEAPAAEPAEAPAETPPPAVVEPEPVVEPVVEPVAEPVVEPVVEPVAEPVVEPVAEEAAPATDAPAEAPAVSEDEGEKTDNA